MHSIVRFLSTLTSTKQIAKQIVKPAKAMRLDNVK